MGCFDSNCCLTGLPLHNGDPVRAGLLVPSSDPFGRGHAGMPAGVYQFWTPPVHSTYNDYGNLEWCDIPEDEKTILEFLLKITLPALEDHEQYSRNIFKESKNDISMERLWDACYIGEVELDPNRPGRIYQTKNPDATFVDVMRNARPYIYGFNGPTIFRRWMCHEWAWDAICDIHKPTPDLEKHVDLFCRTSDMIHEIIENAGVEFRTDEWIDLFRELTSTPHWVCGDQGAFAIQLSHLIRSLKDVNESEFKANLETFKKLVLETATMVSNMFFVRKHLSPLATVGEQYEQFEHLPKWTRLISRKTVEMKRRRET